MTTRKTVPGISLSHITSLIVLAALVVVIGLLSFRVMSVFLLPLFLAGMTAVLFRPLHVWLTQKCNNRPRLAAMLTTLAILLCVLLPSAGIGLMAASEAATLSQELDRDAIARTVVALRNRWSLGPPPIEVMRALDRLHSALDHAAELPTLPRGGGAAEAAALTKQIQADRELVETQLKLNPSAAPAAAAAVAPPAASPSASSTGTAPAASAATATAAPTASATATAAPVIVVAAEATKPTPDEIVVAWKAFDEQLSKPVPPLDDPDSWFVYWDGARRALAKFHNELLGGPIAAWFKQNVNLEPDALQGIVDRARSAAGPLALGTTQFLASFFMGFTLGLIILLVAVYYFLIDGKQMIAAVMRLTPLDNSYLGQLVDEFANLTRAVVLSMLLAATVQGVLAGIGYWFVGVNAVFLLTMLTTLFAMLPLVGATAIWGGCSLWLYLHDGRTAAAVALAVYGVCVISLADNLIKPMVLHGRSNLHPLPALLSVIGGAAALGPIGVFVGPMVVALLHTLLVMLRKELTTIEKTSQA